MFKAENFLILIFTIFISPFISNASTLKGALGQAAAYFTKTSAKIQSGQQIVIKVINYHSQERDQLAQQIEIELYFALEKQSTNLTLIDLSEAVAGVSSKNTVFIKGSYQQKGEIVTLRLQAVKGAISGEILSQIDVKFGMGSTRSRSLVAVLDIESDTLGDQQRKAYSDVFRSILNQIDEFDLASSADIDKMDPDQIQKATGCTRDTCATIIGEQLGVDRVISSSLFKIGSSNYIISAKLMDIEDGAIISSRSVEHKGDLETLNQSLRRLAFQLAGKKDPGVVQVAEKESSNLIWHITAISIAVVSTWQAMDEAGKYNELAEANTLLAQDATDVFSADYINLKDEYTANQEQMEQHESNIQMFNALTALALIWEGYLIFFSSDDEVVSAPHKQRRQPVGLAVVPVVYKTDMKLAVSISWEF